MESILQRFIQNHQFVFRVVLEYTGHGSAGLSHAKFSCFLDFLHFKLNKFKSVSLCLTKILLFFNDVSISRWAFTLFVNR
jgi:hypothetical protein